MNPSSDIKARDLSSLSTRFFEGIGNDYSAISNAMTVFPNIDIFQFVKSFSVTTDKNKLICKNLDHGDLLYGIYCIEELEKISIFMVTDKLIELVTWNNPEQVDGWFMFDHPILRKFTQIRVEVEIKCPRKLNINSNVLVIKCGYTKHNINIPSGTMLDDNCDSPLIFYSEDELEYFCSVSARDDVLAELIKKRENTNYGNKDLKDEVKDSDIVVVEETIKFTVNKHRYIPLYLMGYVTHIQLINIPGEYRLRINGDDTVSKSRNGIFKIEDIFDNITFQFLRNAALGEESKYLTKEQKRTSMNMSKIATIEAIFDEPASDEDITCISTIIRTKNLKTGFRSYL